MSSNNIDPSSSTALRDLDDKRCYFCDEVVFPGDDYEVSPKDVTYHQDCVPASLEDTSPILTIDQLRHKLEYPWISVDDIPEGVVEHL